MAPFSGDRILAEEKRCQLDRLYQRICDNLDDLLRSSTSQPSRICRRLSCVLTAGWVSPSTAAALVKLR